MANNLIDNAKEALARFHGDSLQGVLLRTDDSELDANEIEFKEIFKSGIPNKELIEEDYNLLMRTLELLRFMIRSTIALIRDAHSKGNDSQEFKAGAVSIAQEFEKIGSDDLAQYIYAVLDMIPTFVPMLNNDDGEIDW